MHQIAEIQAIKKLPQTTKHTTMSLLIVSPFTPLGDGSICSRPINCRAVSRSVAFATGTLLSVAVGMGEVRQKIIFCNFLECSLFDQIFVMQATLMPQHRSTCCCHGCCFLTRMNLSTPKCCCLSPGNAPINDNTSLQFGPCNC